MEWNGRMTNEKDMEEEHEGLEKEEEKRKDMGKKDRLGTGIQSDKC